jgi:hypothetical protein
VQSGSESESESESEPGAAAEAEFIFSFGEFIEHAEEVKLTGSTQNSQVDPAV